MAALRITEGDLRALRKHLRDGEPGEEGAFIVVGAVDLGEGRFDLVARELVPPREDDWQERGTDWLTPTTDYINRAALRAEAAGLGLAFVHSHPGAFHPPGLSGIDRRSTEKLFANLRPILGDVPLASLVFTATGFAGIADVQGSRFEFDRVRTVGERVDTRPNDRLDDDSRPTDGAIGEVHVRQLLALGKEGQARLAQVRIAVVGAGGTGSAVVEQIVRMGVRHIWVLDDDRLEASNVSRVYGSRRRDVRGHPYKVDVVVRNARGIAPDAHVVGLPNSVLDQAVQPLLRNMDIVFGCTDTDSSRAQLNDLAYQSYVTVIDLGCRIQADAGQLQGVLGRVRILRPELPCLWCTGTIDGRRILQESMSPAERASLAASGYGAMLGPQPSVVHLTSLVASLGVHEFLALVAGAGLAQDGREVFVDLMGTRLMRATSASVVGCRCQVVRGWGSEWGRSRDESQNSAMSGET